jgi:hypothetical protein
MRLVAPVVDVGINGHTRGTRDADAPPVVAVVDVDGLWWAVDGL